MRRIVIYKTLATIGILTLVIGLCCWTRFPVWGQAIGTDPGVSYSQNVQNVTPVRNEPQTPDSTGIRLSELVTSSDGVITRPMASVSLTEEQKKEVGVPLPPLSAPASLTGKKKDDAAQMPQVTQNTQVAPSASTPFPAVSSLSKVPAALPANAPVSTAKPAVSGTVSPLSAAPSGQPSATAIPRSSVPVPAPATPSMSILPEPMSPLAASSGNAKRDGTNLPQAQNKMQTKISKQAPSAPSSSSGSGLAVATPDFVRPTKANFPGLVPGTGLDSTQPKTGSVPASKPSTKAGETTPQVVSQSPKGMMGQGRPGPSQMEGAQEACVVLEKIAPKEVQVNREETFGIIVKNTGKGTAKDVVLRDQIPARTILVSTTPKVEPGGEGELVWKPFDLGPGEQKEFKYVLIPQEEGELGSVAAVTFSAEASARTRSTKPVLRLDVKAPQEVVIGGEFTLEISISNTGTGTANGVVLLETVPEELYHPGGKVLDNQIKTIAPQETKQLTLTLKGTKPGKAMNRLTVTADNGHVEERETPIMVTSPELQLEIVGSKSRYLDREATYVLKIRNPGTAVAKEVRLIAELPKNVEFVRTNNLGEYNKEKHAVLWELVELPQSLPPGELELVVKPVQAGSGRIVLRGSGQNDLAAEVSQDIVIDGLPALAYEVRSLTDPVEVGKEAVYEVRISNRGTKVSTNVNMSILIPAEMKIIASDGPTTFRENDKGVTFGRLDSLDPKKEAIYRIRAVCSKPGDHRIKVQVSSDDMELLVKEESTRVYY